MKRKVRTAANRACQCRNAITKSDDIDILCCAVHFLSKLHSPWGRGLSKCTEGRRFASAKDEFSPAAMPMTTIARFEYSSRQLSSVHKYIKCMLLLRLDGNKQDDVCG